MTDNERITMFFRDWFLAELQTLPDPKCAARHYLENPWELGAAESSVAIGEGIRQAALIVADGERLS